jgi:acetyl/propionyl-CoA carboxylase alpha subunit
MGEAAVRTAKASCYVNAGTVEFLLDQDGSFYFLEVNTRIQVEHPITEEVVGVDLVSTQFRIANGEKLPWTQEELQQRGHAIETRIYAEDPAAGFLPSGGPLLHLEEPQGPGVRLDSGVVAGMVVPNDYDPIMAKLITYGSTREDARTRMIQALENYVALGVPTTAPFLRDVIASEPFREGATYTDFIETHFPDWTGHDVDEEKIALAAAAFLARKQGFDSENGSDGVTGIPSPWEAVGHWRMGENA